MARRDPELHEKESGVLTSPYLHTVIGPKVLVKLGNTIAIGIGDHTPDVMGPPPRRDNPDIYILHYPFSTFAALKRKRDLSRADFAANPALPALYGWHVRRWIRLDEEDRLWQEYLAHFIEDADLPALLASGAVAIDNSVLERRLQMPAKEAPMWRRLFAWPAFPRSSG